MTSKLPAVLDHIESGLDAARGRWFDLLRIPSVSAQPAHAGDCTTAAEWLRAALAAIGFDAKLVQTKGHPVVLAHHPGTAPGPRVLYYGHYDVQPADPLELWHSAPFEPVLSDGPHGPRITARGSGGRQGPGDDVAGSAAGLACGGRRPSPARHRADRGRGRGRQRQPRPGAGREPGGPGR